MNKKQVLRFIQVISIIGLLLTSINSQANNKVLLNDGTLLPITSFTFDGKQYQVQTVNQGVQRYQANEVKCIGSACGYGTIAPPPSIPAAPAKHSTIGISGSNTVGEALMPALLSHHAQQQQLTTERSTGDSNKENRFVFKDASQQKRFTVNLQTQGSATAFEQLLLGQASMGMSSRRIKPAEQQRLKAAGLGNLQDYGNEHVLALDGLAIIVHRRNTLEALSLADLANVFAGKITDWQQLGGTAGKINVYSLDEQSGTYDTFNSLVLKPQRATLTKAAKRFQSHKALAASIAKDKRGIGFTGFGYIANNRVLALQESCGIRSIPSDFSVKTEEYPLARRLFLYTTNQLTDPHAKSLLKTALSDKAQTVIRDAEFINQHITLSSTSQQNNRLAAALKIASNAEIPLLRRLSSQVAGAKRTSVSFRFKTGSQVLDNKAQEDIGRLVRFLQQPRYANKQLMLLGFSDSKGNFKQNQQLSKKRAQVVANALKKAGVTAKIVKGYGELAPIACNTGTGLQKNRRVEVWLK